MQIAWGADLAFSGRDRLQSAMALIRSGVEGRAATRFDSYLRRYVTLGRALPKEAIVLLHNSHMHLGIDRPVLLDWAGFQGLIDYRRYRTVRDLWSSWKALGVTHVVYEPNIHPTASKQEEVIFATFVVRYGQKASEFEGLRVIEMPVEQPSEEPPYEALLLGVPGYTDGLYQVEGLGNWEHLPPALQGTSVPVRPLHPGGGSPNALLGRAKAVLLGNEVKMDPSFKETVDGHFEKMAAYPGFSVNIRMP